MKTLIIAEKPSVARDLASALGKIPKKNDWYENDEFVISSAVGHLVELFMPEDIDKKLRYWRLESLPILPKKFKLKAIEKTKAQFTLLKKLMNRKDIATIVNGCDAGREGELIFTYIYELAKSKKPVKRLWMQSMTKQGITNAYASLKDGEEMRNLQDAARSRSESDWLIGINCTRALTKRMFGSRRGSVATVGRVQTPTLAMVYERELQIRNFEPIDYWRIEATFRLKSGSYLGVYQKPDFKKNNNDHDKVDRIWEKPQADKILAEIKNAETALVEEKKKRSKTLPPRLYDLTTLQREANNRFGFSAAATLRIAQNLYEKHKLITYPRTDSKALPEDYIPICQGTLQAMSGSVKGFADRILTEGWLKFNKRIFNNAQISDHFAIIPTQLSAEGKKLNADEAKIYDMITRRFISVFYPAAEYDITTRISRVGEHTFKTEGKVLAKAGWLEVIGRNKNGKEEIPPISAEDGTPPKAKIESSELIQEATTPPARYTEATLLTAMETAGKTIDDEEIAEAMKGKGLGTPATRAQIIDHLFHEKYLEREGRELIPTTKAENLIEFLKAMKMEALVSASLTGDWEQQLNQVEKGRMTREAFMKGITDLTKMLIDKTKTFNEDESQFRKTSIIAPSDQKPMLETLRTFKSQDGQITIYKTIGNRKMEEEEVITLLDKRQIGPLDGFRSKSGKPYSAILRLNDEFKIEFVFDNNGNGDTNTGEPLDLSTLKVIGTSPLNGTKVYETPNAYADEKAIEGDRKGFRLSRKLLGKTIELEQAEKLIRDKKTDLIEGFRSNRTKRLFSAFLILKDSGQIGFEFPPRAAKKTAAKKSAKKAASKKKTT